jgi:hypothetical protein
MWYVITRQEVVQLTVEAAYRVWADDEVAAFERFESGAVNDTRRDTVLSPVEIISHEIASVDPMTSEHFPYPIANFCVLTHDHA